MSDNNACKGKHLRMEDRLIIEYGVDENYTLKEIAERIKKDPTTVSKEIKRNRFLKVNKLKENDLRSCQHRRSCTKTNLCVSGCGKQCKKCSFINCYRTCKEYSVKKCSKLNRYPYVCNSCNTVTTCADEKSYYKAKVADSKYKELLVASREGLNITSNELKKMDEKISPLILKGQSISHIFTHHKGELDCYERTLYYILIKMLLQLETLIYLEKLSISPERNLHFLWLKNQLAGLEEHSVILLVL